jgi:hypothetical protein
MGSFPDDSVMISLRSLYCVLSRLIFVDVIKRIIIMDDDLCMEKYGIRCTQDRC